MSAFNSKADIAQRPPQSSWSAQEDTVPACSSKSGKAGDDPPINQDRSWPRADAPPVDAALSIDAAICAAVRDAGIGRHIGVGELNRLVDALTARLRPESGTADHKAAQRQLRYVDTLIAAARNFTCDFSEIRNVENALEMAERELVAARLSLWGPELGSD